jgi:hypothetical protein
LYALLGRFHLSGALFEPIIPQTVEALQQINSAVVLRTAQDGALHNALLR